MNNPPSSPPTAAPAGADNFAGQGAHRVSAASYGGEPGGISRQSVKMPLYQTAFDYSKEVRVVHRENVASPAPLGLLGFALTTALLQGANTAITEKSTNLLVYSFAFFYGGLAQLLAGMWEFKRQNTFGATAFTSYGAWWMSFALYGILVSAGVFKPPLPHDGEKMLLALWGILTFILMVPTLELNFALFSLFLTLSILFFLLTGGIAAPNPWTKIGGWWGLVVAGIAFYIAAADLINEEMQMTVLPLGKWSVGRPIMRSLRRFFSKIPGFNICTRGAAREDELSGFVSKGKKIPSSAPPSRTESGVEPSSPSVWVDVYTEERETGRPHLYTASEGIPASSFEGAAVQRAARKADVRSGFGPF